MVDAAEQIYERAQAALGPGGRLPMPPVAEWDTFPFDGDQRVRELRPPADVDPPRVGEDRADCWRCQHGIEGAVWTDDRWMIAPLEKPSGLPLVVILQPRDHHDIADLPPDLLGDLGPLMQRIERAITGLGDIGRVHICRWGDGSAHFHVWFMARPARMPQLLGSFAAIWNDILPPPSEEAWRSTLADFARALAATGGTAHV